ncbi:toll/interleukin-1 receptor domain-containing protein [Fodinicola acaciae]|uniref:toll/interleukin-1 receptor domain-containing protein n=1 Tax=Fodinicola acaciae TaxID=2681555 RepID=UPI0013D60988|nr:TIR domain-containing protein [Fodinicola acaciae]
MPDWDVFVSYSRDDDAAPASILASALRDHGLRVFWDDHDVPLFQPISDTILGALRSSRALLAFYSARYPLRQACQYELTAAFLAGQQEGAPSRRVMVVNPEPGVDHIHPLQLRDARHARAPRTRSELAALVARITEHLRTIESPIGDVETLGPPLWLPAPARPPAASFDNRLAELWQLHSVLHPYDGSITSGRIHPIAVVIGPAGAGKTALVTEYAHRFGAAYPGGIFWLDAAENDLISQLDHLARAVTGATAPPGAAMNAIATELHRRRQRTLWILDGLVAEPSAARRFLAPHPLSRSIVTTRDPALAALGRAITIGDLAVLDVRPTSAIERTLAWQLQVELAHYLPLVAAGQQRDAMTALHRLFGLIRDMLREGRSAPFALLGICVELLHKHLRPLLAHWHPALQSYEATRTGTDPLQHERSWARHDELAAALGNVREQLSRTLADLAVITGSTYGSPSV